MKTIVVLVVALSVMNLRYKTINLGINTSRNISKFSSLAPHLCLFLAGDAPKARVREPVRLVQYRLCYINLRIIKHLNICFFRVKSYGVRKHTLPVLKAVCG